MLLYSKSTTTLLLKSFLKRIFALPFVVIIIIIVVVVSFCYFSLLLWDYTIKFYLILQETKKPNTLECVCKCYSCSLQFVFFLMFFFFCFFFLHSIKHQSVNVYLKIHSYVCKCMRVCMRVETYHCVVYWQQLLLTVINIGNYYELCIEKIKKSERRKKNNV